MPRHRVLTPLRWSDMDAYGHVNNVQFLRLIEDARVVAFAAAGTDEGGSVVNTGLIVASARIEYLEQLVYRTAPVAIDLWVTSIAGASFDLGYEVLDEKSDDDGGPRPHVYARAETTLVTYDLTGHRPRRITAEERVTLEQWRDEPVQWRQRPARR
jgi:acyl-CoA thioester hydrolase